MMSHPDSEALAWERVSALEAEIRRIRGLYARAIHVLHAWSTSVRRQHADPEVRGPAREVLAGLAIALDETARKLESEGDR